MNRKKELEKILATINPNGVAVLERIVNDAQNSQKNESSEVKPTKPR